LLHSKGRRKAEKSGESHTPANAFEKAKTREFPRKIAGFRTMVVGLRFERRKAWPADFHDEWRRGILAVLDDFSARFPRFMAIMGFPAGWQTGPLWKK